MAYFMANKRKSDRRTNVSDRKVENMIMEFEGIEVDRRKHGRML